jgi:hypothetical protein
VTLANKLGACQRDIILRAGLGIKLYLRLATDHKLGVDEHRLATTFLHEIEDALGKECLFYRFCPMRAWYRIRHGSSIRANR